MTDAGGQAVELFRAAVEGLANFAADTKILGPNFGVAIAVLLHRSDPTRFVIAPSGSGVSTHDLQLSICDPTWAKQEDYLPSNAEGPIYKTFTSSFKGRSPAVNNWRNSFDIQGGIGCSAPYTPAFFQSSTYISEHRYDCAFRDATNGHCGAAGNGAVCFNPNKRGDGPASWSATSARYRPKILRRGKASSGDPLYWSVDPTVDSLADLLGSPTSRVPAELFANALFAGSPYWSKWSDDHSAMRLQRELSLDDELFFTLFEGAASTAPGAAPPARPSTSKEPTASPKPSGSASALNSPVDYVDRDASLIIRSASREADPERRRRLLESATRGHRRILNTISARLRDNDFLVDEQPGGYDLHAFDGHDRHVLFEAKTWTISNLASQVRSGWAQLEEYAYRNRDLIGESPELVLLLNRTPPSNFWAWSWFDSRRAPYVIWTEGSRIATFKQHASWLQELVGPDPQ